MGKRVDFIVFSFLRTLFIFAQLFFKRIYLKKAVTTAFALNLSGL